MKPENSSKSTTSRTFPGRRHWTPNERRYINSITRSGRLGFTSILAIYLPFLLLLFGAMLYLAVKLADGSPLTAWAFFMGGVVWVCLAGIGLPALLRGCRETALSPWVVSLSGKLDHREIEMVESPNLTVTLVGNTSVWLPPGWEGFLKEGDEMEGEGYELQSEMVYGGKCLVLLTLSNGFSVDKEVELGLLGHTGPLYWVFAVCGTVLWGVLVGFDWLAGQELPKTITFWVPLGMVGALAGRAIWGSLVNRKIWPRIMGFRENAQGASAKPKPATTDT